MRVPAGKLIAASAVAALLTGLSLPNIALADSHGGMSSVEKGKAVAFDRKKGNCLACHQMAGGKLPGNIGPPLIAMKARFPDRAKLRAQIWDATKKNPNSMMPPFGRHKIVSESEIDAIVDFVLTL